MLPIKIIYSTLLLSCFLAIGFAQNMPPKTVNLKWGEEFKRPSWSTIEKIIGTDGGGLYAWRVKRGNIHHVEHYDPQMNLKKSNKINLKYKRKIREKEVEDIIYFNGKLVLFTSFMDKQKDRNMLFAQEIDKKTMIPSANAPMVAMIPAKRRSNKGIFAYAISRDSSKLLIYNEMPYDKRGFARFAFRVFDVNFKKLWEKEVELPFRDKLFETKDYRVDNAGNVYLSGKLYRGKVRDRRGGKPNYEYIILAYRNNGAEHKQYKVDLGKEFINELTYRIANNGHLICAGFYSERNSHGLRGSFYFKVDAESEKLYDLGKSPFSKEFLAKFMSERRAEKGKELYRYNLDRLILRSDGGALLVAEQFFIRVLSYYDRFSGTWVERYTYYYNDIITVNINPNGSIAWATKIPKRQVDGTGLISSYAMTIVRDKIHFIFNDHPKNLREKDPDRLRNFKGKRSVVTLATLKSNGDYDKYPLFYNKDYDIITRPKICRQVGKNEMVVYGEYRKRYKFGKVVFNAVSRP